MNDSFNGDLLPFIQDSIRRGYAKPSWYLIVVEHGFEITQGNVLGLGDANFSVRVGGSSIPSLTAASQLGVASPSSISPTSTSASGPAITSPPVQNLRVAKHMHHKHHKHHKRHRHRRHHHNHHHHPRR
jgi:hypothetical protein